jgi:hypothetical protein
MGYPEYPDYFLFEDNTARGPDKSYGAIYPASGGDCSGAFDTAT